jgi:WD40 repeat protein
VVLTVKEGLGNRVHCVAFSPDGRTFAVGAVPGFKVFTVEAGGPGKPVALRRRAGPPEGSSVGHLCFSPGGKLLAWTTNDGGIVQVWDLERGRALPSPGQVFARIQSLGFFPDGKRLIFLNREQAAEVWDVTAGRKTASFPAGLEGGRPSSYALHVGLSPDGRWLAASSASGRGVNVWDVERGRLLVPLPEEKGTVWCLTWGPDSRRLAVSRSDGGLAVWDLDSVRRQLAELGAGW